MVNRINATEFLNLRDNSTPVIDVRTPLEFNESHIPGAINIPLFSDEERVIVGTAYKQENKESALIKALDFTGPKLSSFIKSLNKVTQKREVLVYCWRGGFRSQSMAWLFDLAGYKTSLLEGGYRAYRNHLKEYFENDQKIIILGGMTGSGKSEILPKLKRIGQQIIDLEGLANHKGSAFGAMGQDDQPTIKQFENLLGEKWRKLDQNKPVWLEDESASIGKVSIPKEIFIKMRNSFVVKIEREKRNRIERLVREYALFSKDELKTAIIKITKKLGGLNTTLCLEAIDNSDYELVVDLSLIYYDRAYTKGITKRDPSTVFSIFIKNNETEAEEIMEFFSSKNIQ